MAQNPSLIDDTQFFSAHPDRQSRIRPPSHLIDMDRRSHVTKYVWECEKEFISLGDHSRDRRRILVWRVPPDNPYYKKAKQPLVKIPFLLFSDETVEDNDETLLPILHQIMLEQRDRIMGY